MGPTSVGGGMGGGGGGPGGPTGRGGGCLNGFFSSSTLNCARGGRTVGLKARDVASGDDFAAARLGIGTLGETQLFTRAPPISTAISPKAIFRNCRGLFMSAFFLKRRRVSTDHNCHLQFGARPGETRVDHELGHGQELSSALDLIQEIAKLLEISVQGELHRNLCEPLCFLRRVDAFTYRSEERRVGKECRSRW